ncbi:MAG: hypothetical protein AAF799_35180 [Myxococcota bacterium]
MEHRLLHFMLVSVGGWLNRHQAAQLAYLRDENRVLKEHLGKKRLRFTDAQRRQLATRAKFLGRGGLLGLATIVTPETLMRWVPQAHRQQARREPNATSRMPLDY